MSKTVRVSKEEACKLAKSLSGKIGRIGTPVWGSGYASYLDKKNPHYRVDVWFAGTESADLVEVNAVIGDKPYKCVHDHSNVYKIIIPVDPASIPETRKLYGFTPSEVKTILYALKDVELPGVSNIIKRLS